MALKYESKRPTVDEYNSLMQAVGWGRVEANIIEEALDNTLYTICAYDEEKIVGLGRLIGDKLMYVHIHSIMILPEYQGKEIGTKIVQELIKYVKELKKINPRLKTYLQAVKGKEKFYEKFGFVARPTEDLGPGMILKEE